jgi:hypothetical protein
MSCHLRNLPWPDGDQDQYVLYLYVLYLRVPRRSEYAPTKLEGPHEFHEERAASPASTPMRASAGLRPPAEPRQSHSSGG